jgi:epsin
MVRALELIRHVEPGLTCCATVRISAKELTSLLLDEERLRNERKDRKSWKSRVHGIDQMDYPQSSNGYPGARDERSSQRRRRHSNPNPSRNDQEEWEYKLAIEASKNQAEEDRKRQSQQNTDDDLAKAIRLSKEEEERRQRELEQSNADSLFDDIPIQPTAVPQQQPQFQFPQSDYQQGQMVDMWGNPINQQNTGYLNNIYAQPTAQFQGQQYPQPTGFDGYMAPLPAQPTGYVQNPYYQNNGLSPQQTAVQYPTPGNNNPYANGLQPQQALQPLPTGSNNPFAPKMATYGTQSPPRTAQQPSLATLAEQQRNQQAQQQQYQYQQQQQQQQYSQSQPSFSTDTFSSLSISSTPTPAQQQKPQKPINPQHAHLEALLQSGNGLDTFGNTGDLRIPAQHTAPGTFVNSAGAGMRPGQNGQQQQPANNPYLNGQFTGMPQSTGFAGGLAAPQQQRLVPSHTGPAGMYNGGNPFGQQQGYGQQQQHQQMQQQDLIDF